MLDESLSLDEEDIQKIETSTEERPSNLLRDYMRNMEKKSQTPRLTGTKNTSLTASKNVLAARQRRGNDSMPNGKNIKMDLESLRNQRGLRLEPGLSSHLEEPEGFGKSNGLAASGIPLSGRGNDLAGSGTLTKHKSQSRKEKQRNKALRERFKKKEMDKWRQDVFLKYKKSWGPQMMSPHAFQPDSYNESDLNGLYQSNKVEGGVSSMRVGRNGGGFNYNTERSGKFGSNYSKNSKANMRPRYTAEEAGSLKSETNYLTQTRNMFKGSDLIMPGISNKKSGL